MATLIGKLVPQESVIGTVVLGEVMGYFAVIEKQRVLFWRPFELPPVKNGAKSNLDRVGDEISKCVSHMVGTLHLDASMDIYMFGAGPQHETVGTYLSNRFNMQVKSPSPFESLPETSLSAELKISGAGRRPNQFAAAFGLAFQPAGGTNG